MNGTTTGKKESNPNSIWSDSVRDDIKTYYDAWS